MPHSVHNDQPGARLVALITSWWCEGQTPETSLLFSYSTHVKPTDGASKGGKGKSKAAPAPMLLAWEKEMDPERLPINEVLVYRSALAR